MLKVGDKVEVSANTFDVPKGAKGEVIRIHEQPMRFPIRVKFKKSFDPILDDRGFLFSEEELKAVKQND